MYDNHDMAEAIIPTEETSNVLVDKVREHGKEHGELGKLSYWTDNITELWQRPNRKPW